MDHHGCVYADRSQRACQEAPATALSSAPLSLHAQKYGAEERSDEETHQCLHVVHDALEVSHQVRCADARDDADDRAPPTHSHVVSVRSAPVHVGAIDVISPDRGKGAYVASHA